MPPADISETYRTTLWTLRSSLFRSNLDDDGIQSALLDHALLYRRHTIPLEHNTPFAIKWLQLPIKVWHSDNKKTVDDQIRKVLDEMGFIYTFTVPYSPEMNGPGERSGGVLTLRARALIKEGKLPDKL
ncbi:uncharacterized protein N7484_000578 [Penicillium longicatenatum]|uniref:uncharacterized protein n=1 Tax=Penicillium longicatenatum TaxID=1561947 RepID=UPI002548AE8E|nr:uncharacterized protein N7484_000578 [Penicillium longicatenatum]KAJ5661206.1 hypothetical protein N7484_000578 [Penicillium longicatenatum]